MGKQMQEHSLRTVDDDFTSSYSELSQVCFICMSVVWGNSCSRALQIGFRTKLYKADLKKKSTYGTRCILQNIEFLFLALSIWSQLYEVLMPENLEFS